jgi:hypothetical protein
MINLQGCDGIRKTDDLVWLAADDTAYCSTYLGDNEIILAVTRNAANEKEATENSAFDEAFRKLRILKVKNHLKLLLLYRGTKRVSTWRFYVN